MYLCPFQSAVPASSHPAVSGEVGHFMLDLISVAVGFLTGFAFHSFPHMAVKWLVDADVHRPPVYLQNAVVAERFQFTDTALKTSELKYNTFSALVFGHSQVFLAVRCHTSRRTGHGIIGFIVFEVMLVK